MIQHAHAARLKSSSGKACWAWHPSLSVLGRPTRMLASTLAWTRLG